MLFAHILRFLSVCADGFVFFCLHTEIGNTGKSLKYPKVIDDDFLQLTTTWQFAVLRDWKVVNTYL